MSTYTKVLQASRDLHGLTHLALRNDLTEMFLTMAASAGINPLPGLAAAARAGAAMWTAKARCDSALLRISNVVEGWLSASANSPQLLDQNAKQWDQLGHRAQGIARDMEALLSRSRNNTWEGEAHQEKDEFHQAELESVTAFSEALGAMPAMLETTNVLTKRIFESVLMPLRASRMVGQTIAGRFPVPRPSGFGLCTRTPTLATEFEGLAATVAQVQVGGSWRLMEMGLGLTMAQVSKAIDSRGGKPRP